MEITSLSEVLASVLAEGRLRLPSYGGQKVFFHDSRSAFQLGERSARAEAIQPGYRGPETMSGEGEVYEAPRRLLDAIGHDALLLRLVPRPEPQLGADDGLWRTYPGAGRSLAQARLARSHGLGRRAARDRLACWPRAGWRRPGRQATLP